MKISELVRAIGVPDFNYVPMDIECGGIKFKVKIKKEMSAADVEFIYKPKNEFDDSVAYRRIHRFVLFVSEGEDERPSMQQIESEFPVSLVSVLIGAIDSVHVKKSGGDKPVKKNLRRVKSSGTS